MREYQMNDFTRNLRRYRGKLQAVILDWAGTTVDYGSFSPIRAMQQVFRNRGIAVSDDEVRRDMGLLKKDHIRSLLHLPRVAEAWRQQTGREAAESDVEELYAEFQPLQLARLGQDSDLIPGVAEAVARMRRRGLKIGSTTGYTRPMLEILLRQAAAQGYEPDCSLVPDDVGGGRPQPWMCYEIALRLKIFPLESFVKVGDTVADTEEGLNAGMWTVGVVRTGNMVGLTQAQFAALAPAEREARLEAGRQHLKEAGTHYVIDNVSDFDPVFDEIEARLERGERP
jgi:phosphonoacetaldehyde hydrolase